MEPLLPATHLAGRACWPETPPRDRRGDLHALSAAALPTAPCNRNTVLAYDLSDSNSVSPWEEQEHLPAPLSSLSQLSGPAGPEQRVVLIRPSSWVMLSILEPNLVFSSPVTPGPGPAYASELTHSAPSLSRSGKPGLQPSHALGLDSCFCDELYLHPVKGNEFLWREEQDFFL